MTKNKCVGHDVLIDYLYGEADAETRQGVESHLDECRVCAEEIQGLKNVRRTLDDWSPPAVEPRVRVPAGAGAPPPVSVRARWWRAPAWGLAAAAVLVLGAGLVIAKPELQIGQGGMVLRVGWTEALTAPPPRPALRVGDIVLAPETSRDVRTLRGMPVASGQPAQGLRAALPVRENVGREGIGTVDTDNVSNDWRQGVLDMIIESERRQKLALADGLQEFKQQQARQRQAALDEMERTFTDVDTADAELTRQQLLEYMRRISAQ